MVAKNYDTGALYFLSLDPFPPYRAHTITSGHYNTATEVPGSHSGDAGMVWLSEGHSSPSERHKLRGSSVMNATIAM
jgi:hypothetical protein